MSDEKNQTTTTSEAEPPTVAAPDAGAPTDVKQVNALAVIDEPGDLPDLEVVLPTKRMINNLGAEDQATARDLVAKSGLGTDEEVITYGTKVVQEIGDFVTELSLSAKPLEVDAVTIITTRVRSLVEQMEQGFGIDDPPPGAWGRFTSILSTYVPALERFKQKKVKVDEQIEEIKEAITTKEVDATQNGLQCDKQYGINTRFLKTLQIRIAAGEILLEMADKKYDEMVAALGDSQDLVRRQELVDYVTRVELFAAVVHDLWKAYMQTYLRGPGIKASKANAIRLRTLMASLRATAIPNIQMEMARAITLWEQKKILAAGDEVADLNERSMVHAAEQAKELAEKTLLAQRRGIGSIEAYRKVKDTLIATLDSTAKLMAENSAIRVMEQGEMRTMQEDVKNAQERFTTALIERRRELAANPDAAAAMLQSSKDASATTGNK